MSTHYHALGLMSGTSLDGIDAALIRTDGIRIFNTGTALTVPYTPLLRQKLRALMHGEGDALTIEHELTRAHADIVYQMLERASCKAADIDVIGFHGQTIIHRPEEGLSWQLGNGGLLAARTGINVVCDFRRRDMALGGQGAPLVPVYHAALAEAFSRPIAMVNIGGVSNVTWIGEDTTKDILAFDTGPGNALLDDWVYKHTGCHYDEGGALAASGTVDECCLAEWLAHAFFTAIPPKSLDRHSFSSASIAHLSAADGAATLAAFTVESLLKAAEFFPAPVKEWLIAGGGRHNHFIMERLAKRLPVPVSSIDTKDHDGDALEAQAFAFLAVRSLLGLPLSYPSTTGVTLPVTGGAFYRA